MINLASAFYTALAADTAITTLLGTWNSNPSIHTRRPIPADAGYPLIIVSPDISVGDQDALNTFRSVIVKDLSVYGIQPDQYRTIESLGLLLRNKFHRLRWSITPPAGYKIIDIVALGPSIAPTDDDKKLGRVVSLTVRVQPTS